MGNRVYDMAMELLQEEAYAMHESYNNEQIAECVQKIVGRLNRHGHKYSQTITADLGLLQIKVKNASSRNGGSFVSMSDETATYVSKSLSEIIDVSVVCTEDEVKGLIEMMDEAFFALNDSRTYFIP